MVLISVILHHQRYLHANSFLLNQNLLYSMTHLQHQIHHQFHLEQIERILRIILKTIVVVREFLDEKIFKLFDRIRLIDVLLDHLDNTQVNKALIQIKLTKKKHLDLLFLGARLSSDISKTNSTVTIENK